MYAHIAWACRLNRLKAGSREAACRERHDRRGTKAVDALCFGNLTLCLEQGPTR